MVAKEIRELTHRMSWANPTWGSPRIIGEIQKLGIEAAKSTMVTYRIRPSYGERCEIVIDRIRRDDDDRV